MPLDSPTSGIFLLLLGIFTGAIAGLLGLGGGLVLVPILTALGVPIVKATATSLVCVLLSSISGSLRNWRSGELQLSASLALALGGIPTAQLGAWLGDRLPSAWLAFSFAGLQLTTIYLMGLRRKLQNTETGETIEQGSVLPSSSSLPKPKIMGIGLLAGLLSGLFGVGGGVVMVPLQMLLLSVPIKQAVRTSLGAIVLISASGLAQHTYNGNVLWITGICLGLGGIVGAQLGARLLPRLPAQLVSWLFRLLLIAMAIYMIAKGIQAIRL